MIKGDCGKKKKTHAGIFNSFLQGINSQTDHTSHDSTRKYSLQ